jgi:hypothetical protein
VGRRKKSPNKLRIKQRPAAPISVQVVQPSQLPILIKNKERGENGNKINNPSTESITTKEVKALGKFGVRFLAHLVAVLFLVSVGIGTHFILKDLLSDPKILDFIPVRYAVEMGDGATIIVLIGKFIWGMMEDKE